MKLLDREIELRATPFCGPSGLPQFLLETPYLSEAERAELQRRWVKVNSGIDFEDAR